MSSSSPPPVEPEWYRTQAIAVAKGAEQRARAEEAAQQHRAWLAHQQYSALYVTSRAQTNPTSRPRLRTWLLGGFVVTASLVLASLFALLYGYNFGLLWTFAGLLAALLPLTLVVPVFLWLDRFEAEPWRYLVTAFLYGALGSTALAIIVNSLGGAFLMSVTDEQAATVATAVFIAPVTEETFKGLFLLVMWWFMRREFNGLTDGIVYAGIVAAGFAFTENIQYFAGAAIEHGVGGFAMTLVVRGLISPFLHPMFTAMTGVGVGLAAVSGSRSTKVLAPVLGWCLAVFAHGLWNLSASSGTVVGMLLGLAGGFVAFIAFVILLVWARRREGQIIGEFLMPYAATGWLSREEVGMLSSVKLRRQARVWAKHHRGRTGTTVMRNFQDCASELALLRRRMHSQSADERTMQRERVLLDSMTARRREFSGAG